MTWSQLVRGGTGPHPTLCSLRILERSQEDCEGPATPEEDLSLWGARMEVEGALCLRLLGKYGKGRGEGGFWI